MAVPSRIRPDIVGDEERFEADLLDLVARPSAWGIHSKEQAQEVYDRMTLMGKKSRKKKSESRVKAETSDTIGSGVCPRCDKLFTRLDMHVCKK